MRNGRLHVGAACDGKRQIAKIPEEFKKNLIKEVKKEAFSVLCIEEGAEWVEYKQGPRQLPYTMDWSVFPKHAVVAGFNSSESVLYVGRAAIDGQMVPGFFEPTGWTTSKITVIHQGKVHEKEEFEALVIRNKTIEIETEKK